MPALPALPPRLTRMLDRRRLSLKLSLAYSVLLLIVSAVLSYTLYRQVQDEQQQSLREQLRYLLMFAGPQVDSQFHAAIKQPIDELASSYSLIYLRLRTIQHAIGAIQHIYTLRLDANYQLVYVVDAASAPAPHARVNQPYPRPVPALVQSWPALTGPLVDATWRVDPGGQVLWSGYTPIYDTNGQLNGVLGIDIDASGVMASQRTALRRALLAFMVMTGLALLIGWVVVDTFTAPVFELTEGALRVAQGDLDQPVPVRSNDELGRLAESFNTMQAGLSESRQQLEEYARTLEQRVEQRTGELMQANAEIRALNKRLAAENLRMEAELDVARRLQQMLLPSPSELEQIAGLDMAGFMRPADEVGGDYYDVLRYGDRVVIGMGDVTGHGLESGVVMLMLQTAIRTLLVGGIQQPAQFVEAVNRAMHANLQRMGVQKSLSLVVLEYQPLEHQSQTGRLDCSRLRLSGQHEQVIVVRQDGQLSLIDTLDLGFPIGLVEGIAPYIHQVEIDLVPGDGIVLFSDGFTEAENPAGQWYGLERLCAVVQANWDRPASAIQQALVADVESFIETQRLDDDLALLVIKQAQPRTATPHSGYPPLAEAAQAGPNHPNEQDFGPFIPADEGQPYLALRFLPPALPTALQPSSYSASADLLADFWAAFHTLDANKPTPGRLAEIKGALAYIANELLENLAKFSYKPDVYGSEIVLCMYPTEFRFYTRNAIHPQAVADFQARIQALLDGDPQHLYLQQVERNVRSENRGQSQLGLLTMINDYGAHLAWRFAPSPHASDDLIVTTLVQLQV